MYTASNKLISKFKATQVTHLWFTRRSELKCLAVEISFESIKSQIPDFREKEIKRGIRSHVLASRLSHALRGKAVKLATTYTKQRRMLMRTCILAVSIRMVES